MPLILWERACPGRRSDDEASPVDEDLDLVYTCLGNCVRQPKAPTSKSAVI